jgi:hypothetical protein
MTFALSFPTTEIAITAYFAASYCAWRYLKRLNKKYGIE